MKLSGEGKLLRLSEDLPMVVEVVDTEEKMNEFLPTVDVLFEKSGSGGMVTIERADIVRYPPGRKQKV